MLALGFTHCLCGRTWRPFSWSTLLRRSPNVLFPPNKAKFDLVDSRQDSCLPIGRTRQSHYLKAQPLYPLHGPTMTVEGGELITGFAAAVSCGYESPARGIFT